MKQTVDFVDTWELYRLPRLSLDENNDCTVRALASAMKVHYFNAHNFLEIHCLRDRKEGIFSFMNFITNRPILNNKKAHMIHDHKCQGMKTVKQFMDDPAYDKGTYMVSVYRHVFTVIDKVIYGNPEDYRSHNLNIMAILEVKDVEEDMELAECPSCGSLNEVVIHCEDDQEIEVSLCCLTEIKR